MATEDKKEQASETTAGVQAQMRKGVLELCILCILSEKDAYPSDIITAMKDSKLIVVEGTLYPLLMRLKNEGRLSYEWKESTSGPPRKYYRLTDSGKDLLKELHAAWAELMGSVDAIIQKYSSITK
jgi:PadR family transcriptional regulator, regulatory protein PadR